MKSLFIGLVAGLVLMSSSAFAARAARVIVKKMKLREGEVVVASETFREITAARFQTGWAYAGSTSNNGIEIIVGNEVVCKSGMFNLGNAGISVLELLREMNSESNLIVECSTNPYAEADPAFMTVLRYDRY